MSRVQESDACVACAWERNSSVQCVDASLESKRSNQRGQAIALVKGNPIPVDLIIACGMRVVACVVCVCRMRVRCALGSQARSGLRGPYVVWGRSPGSRGGVVRQVCVCACVRGHTHTYMLGAEALLLTRW